MDLLKEKDHLYGTIEEQKAKINELKAIIADLEHQRKAAQEETDRSQKTAQQMTSKFEL